MSRVRAFAAAGIVALAAAPAVAQSAPAAREVLRFEAESRYFHIRVVDTPARGRRYLVCSKSWFVQSAMLLDEPSALLLDYTRTLVAALALHPEARDVLLVGLGGGAIPKFAEKHLPEVRLDVVELDPEVVRVCRDYFAYKGGAGTRVFVMDGRLYLKRSAKKYDVILLDAYAAERIPFHLTTVEFLRLVRSRLKPGGVVASNLWEPSRNRFYLAELRTYQEVFPETYLLPVGLSVLEPDTLGAIPPQAIPPRAGGAAIVVGSLTRERVTREAWVERARRLSTGRNLGFDLPGLVADAYRLLTTRRIGEAPLTDGSAPVDALRHQTPLDLEAVSR